MDYVQLRDLIAVISTDADIEIYQAAIYLHERITDITCAGLDNLDAIRVATKRPQDFANQNNLVTTLEILDSLEALSREVDIHYIPENFDEIFVTKSDIAKLSQEISQLDLVKPSFWWYHFDFIAGDSDTPKTSTNHAKPDPDHENWPPELDVAILAWRAVSNGWGDSTENPKERLVGWLRMHYPDLSEEQFKRISTVANWHKTPGRKKRP